MSCNSCNSTKLPVGPPGPPGPIGPSGGDPGPQGDPGIDGLNGLYGGFSSLWYAETNNNPTQNPMFFSSDNSGSPASITVLYFNKTNANSIDLSQFIESFDNGGSFGRIRLFHETNPLLVHYFDLTGISLSGDTYSLTVTYIGGNGSFGIPDPWVLSFSPGASGGGGIVGVHNSVFVSEGSGNNATALANRFDKMFQSLKSAKNAAVAAGATAVNPYTVFVYPGLYDTLDDQDLAADGVNWHFFKGAIVNSSGYGWDDGGVQMTFSITGEGDLSFGIRVLFTSNALSNITVRGVTLRGPSNNYVVIHQGAKMKLQNVDIYLVGSIQGIVGLGTSGLELDNVKMVTDGSTSIDAFVPVNIKIYSTSYTNVNTSGTITNVITGTNLIVDTDVI